MIKNSIKKRVSLFSLNLFGSEVDDSFATLSLLNNVLRINAVGQFEDVPYESIARVEKRWWWYNISWKNNDASIDIKVSAFRLSAFMSDLQNRQILS